MPATSLPPGVHRQGQRVVYRADRPGPGWHAHGTTPQTLWLVHDGRLRRLTLYKQRWKHVATGRTVHDRPPWLLPWSRYGLLTVFTVLWSWVGTPEGLHRTPWPWSSARPSRRSAQRWWSRLRPDALAWQSAIREVLADQLAPRPLKEMFPTGLAPPGRGARHRRDAVKARQLTNGLALLFQGAQRLSIPVTPLTVEARRRMIADAHR